MSSLRLLLGFLLASALNLRAAGTTEDANKRPDQSFAPSKGPTAIADLQNKANQGKAAATDALASAFGSPGPGPEFKKPIEVPDSFFNPFKIQSVNELAPRKKEVAAVTNEQVAEALGKRAISAILYSPDAKRNRAVIGDQNFEAGDELVFMTEKGQREPLVAGVSVFLREIGEKTLEIEIATQGEASRMMAFSLRDFYRQ